ncbi:MAG: CPBP family intramembrane metalloprotease [Acidobacteriia bacterium]|nr:CPBP family intramembrane metalloprotease [Terriglobia bacterium]
MTFATIPWDFALILAALGVLIPWRGTVRVGRLMKKEDLGSSGRLSLYGSTIFFQWLIAGLVFWRALARGMNHAELGLSIADPWRAAWATCGATLLLCAGQTAGLRKMVQLPVEKRGALFRITEKIMPRTWSEASLFAVLACTAGLSEEFLYRGFIWALFARFFSSASGAIFFASCISSLWFAVAHLYQGRRGIITTFVVSMIFSGLRIWSGTLLPSIVAHAAVDLLVGLYVPRLLRKA